MIVAIQAMVARTPFEVLETSPFLTVCVSIDINTILDRRIIVTVSTEDGSAQGMLFILILFCNCLYCPQ